MVSDTHYDAAQGLVAPAVVASVAYRNRVHSVSRDGTVPEMRKFVVALVDEFQRRNFPMFVHCLYRGEKEQARLKAAGNSKAAFGQSAHNYGMAADVVHFGRWWGLTRKEWAIIGLIGKEVARKQNLKITWGGDWSFYDPAHWELADWKKRAGKVPA